MTAVADGSGYQIEFQPVLIRRQGHMCSPVVTNGPSGFVDILLEFRVDDATMDKLLDAGLRVELQVFDGKGNSNLYDKRHFSASWSRLSVSQGSGATWKFMRAEGLRFIPGMEYGMNFHVVVPNWDDFPTVEQSAMSAVPKIRISKLRPGA